jgi:GNAT superfamily N-acetyltransferase
MPIEVKALAGGAIRSTLDDLARLRIEVFRDWPYLYEGTYDYERAYFHAFAESEGAVVVVARDGNRTIGAATGAPMGRHAAEAAEPLRQAGYDLARVFYCGESVLLPAYRGRGLGHAFFEEREAHARALGGFTHVAFCAVVRPPDHPARPANYQPLDAFWLKRGYRPVPGVLGSLTWQDIGVDAETAKPMQFWMKPL